MHFLYTVKMQSALSFVNEMQNNLKLVSKVFPSEYFSKIQKKFHFPKRHIPDNWIYFLNYFPTFCITIENLTIFSKHETKIIKCSHAFVLFEMQKIRNFLIFFCISFEGLNKINFFIMLALTFTINLSYSFWDRIRKGNQKCWKKPMKKNVPIKSAFFTPTEMFLLLQNVQSFEMKMQKVRNKCVFFW